MVPVAVHAREQSHSELVLTVLRAASQRLDTVGGATVDQLFVLEGSIRAGRVAAPLRERLRRVQQDSMWRMEQPWEADVPHATELAQLACVLSADGADVPRAWSARLSDACDRLSRRRSRFDATTDVVLLSTLIRGLAAVGQVVPEGFVNSVEELLAESGASPGLYELSDALARHREHRLLAERVAHRAFSSSSAGAGDAIARWWLAERWRDLTREQLSVAPALLDTARRQSLATAAGADVRIIGMTIEVMGRASEDLVIETSHELAARTSRQAKRRDAEIVAWRFGATACVLIIALVNATRLLGRVLGHDPDRVLVQGTAGVLCAGAAWAIVRGLMRLGMIVGIKIGDAERFVDVVLPLTAGVLGALIYR